ncbi:hypothetical protein BX591_1529 [Paraburkholderia bryophila]|uniref:Uncharacterized protein n=1 Tax=Paraburkholderia bryophila TaxID=420952 RepID=A0A329B775_9BURK|nr:hypothetical protein BX591_1529 [Paraburkholderia bryophila]
MNHSGTTMPTKTIQVLLALTATATAACLSILAGWQRGGLVAERVLLICVGVLLVVAAHLLPGLCRPHGRRIRALGAVLWMGCMVATCYGHAGFFVTAQRHAGEIRAAAVPKVAEYGRNLAAVASDRAGVVARLARVVERKCGERCGAVRIERATLTARLAALDAESAEVTRRDLALDRAKAERTAAKANPVAGLLTVFGVDAGQVDLVAGMAFAVVLEGVACFCWLLALRPSDSLTKAITPARVASHGPAVTPVTRASKVVAPVNNNAIEVEATRSSATGVQADDVARVLTAIRDGQLRSTVTEIRKHLGCSQARAATVRKQIVLDGKQGTVTNVT